MAPADSIGAWQIHNFQHLEKYAGNYPLIHKTIATCSQISIGLSAFPPTSKAPISPTSKSTTFKNTRRSKDFTGVSPFFSCWHYPMGPVGLVSPRGWAFPAAPVLPPPAAETLPPPPLSAPAALGEAPARRVRTREPQARTLRGRRALGARYV